MSISHTVIPVNDDAEWFAEAIDYFAKDMVFIPDSLPRGRFPTLSELRNSILELGYELEEEHDWYASSDDDGVAIWFKGDERHEDQPTGFWFRRGHRIQYNITQAIANYCGSLITSTDWNSVAIVYIPDNLFPPMPDAKKPADFISTIIYRIPIMLERLKTASLDDILLYLSQIRQALRSTKPANDYDLFQAAQAGLPTYLSFLDHDDSRVRLLAFYLTVTFRERYYERINPIVETIQNEPDVEAKAQMVYAIEALVKPVSKGDPINQWTQPFVDLLTNLAENSTEVPTVRFAAVKQLTCAQPGLRTASIQSILEDALIQPDVYGGTVRIPSSIISYALDSIDTFQLNYRINILKNVLPQMQIVEDAHNVLRTLLDYTFFGRQENTGSSSLLESHEAERPEIDKSKFRHYYETENYHFSGWLYPSTATKLTVADISTTQRDILQAVMDIDLPWMVHSNILQKYGLPPTRAQVREMLEVTS